MGKKSSAPQQDPNVALAAKQSAETGAAALAWAKERAVTYDAWAAEDRARYNEKFIPLQDDYIEKAKGWDSVDRQAAEAAQAKADVVNNIALQKQQRGRSMAALGVNPDSGRYAGVERSADLGGALAGAGAENVARDRVRTEAMDLQAQAINMGSGLPAQAISEFGAATGTVQTGYGTSLAGTGQQAQILNNEYQNRLQAYNIDQQQQASLYGGVGSLIGLAFGSSKKIKTRNGPAEGCLEALENMPVDDWTYNEGEGDGGRHVGPYAEDFQRETGKGDGKSINVIDAIGTTIGAVKELAAKVDKLATSRRSPAARGIQMEMAA